MDEYRYIGENDEHERDEEIKAKLDIIGENIAAISVNDDQALDTIKALKQALQASMTQREYLREALVVIGEAFLEGPAVEVFTGVWPD